MGTKRVGWARIKSLINENQNQLGIRNQKVATLATGTTLTASNSGTTYLLVQTAGALTATLPSAAAGLSFRFVLKTAAAGNFTVSQAGSGEDFVGRFSSADTTAGASAASSGNTAIQFMGGTAVAGDWIDIWSDGTNWYCSGTGDTQNGIKFVT
jgi:hypothetical protein